MNETTFVCDDVWPHESESVRLSFTIIVAKTQFEKKTRRDNTTTSKIFYSFVESKPTIFMCDFKRIFIDWTLLFLHHCTIMRDKRFQWLRFRYKCVSRLEIVLECAMATPSNMSNDYLFSFSFSEHSFISCIRLNWNQKFKRLAGIMHVDERMVAIHIYSHITLNMPYTTIWKWDCGLLSAHGPLSTRECRWWWMVMVGQPECFGWFVNRIRNSVEKIKKIKWKYATKHFFRPDVWVCALHCTF